MNPTTPLSATATASGIDDLYRMVLADGLPAEMAGQKIRYRTLRLRETTVADERAAVRLAERVMFVDGQHKLLVSDAEFRYAMTFMHVDAFECDGQALPRAVLSLDVFGKLSAHDLSQIEERVVLITLAAQVRYGLLSEADFAQYTAGQANQAKGGQPPQPVGQAAAVGEPALPPELGPALLADYAADAASSAAAELVQAPAQARRVGRR